MNDSVSLLRLFRTAVMLAVISILIGLAMSFIGPISLFDAQTPFWNNMIWHDRLSRIAAAGLAGAALASSGLALQGLFRNPLANPYVLGISTGAGVGVLIGMVLGASFLPIWLSTPVLAFAGALCSITIVFVVSNKRGHLDPYTLILSGVMVNAINGAVILSIYLIIDPYTLSSFVGWAMGRVPDTVEPALLLITSVGIGTGTLLLFVRGAAINILDLGEVVAAASGVAVKRLRVEVFVAAGAIAGFAVTLVGPVGFLGLFIPHILRLIVGPDHRVLILWSFFIGGSFLIVADSLCRAISIGLSVGTIPVGILTTLAGGPFFIWLLRSKKGSPEQ